MDVDVSAEDLWFDHETIPPHSSVVKIQFGDLHKTLKWCENNCTAKFRYRNVFMPTYDNNEKGAYEFFFVNRNDHLLFMLQWA